MKWRWLGGVALLAASGALVWLLTNYDLALIARLPGRTAVGTFVLALAFSWLYGLGISFLLRAVGFPRSAWKVFWVVSAGGTASYLGNLQLGVPVRVVLFRKILSIPVPQATASIALESACWFALMGTALALAGTWSSPLFWATVALVAVGAWMATRWSVPAGDWILRRLPNKLWGLPLTGVKQAGADLTRALTTAHRGWILCGLTVFAVNYAIDAATLCLIVNGYGEWLSPWRALEAVILSYLAGLVSMIPMGIGVRDVSLVVLLSKAGVSLDTATTTAILHRLLRTVVPLAIGVIAINVIGARAILKSPQPPTDDG